MNTEHIQKAAIELNLKESQVLSVVTLLSTGSTIPFIARYRKELTGSLDEVAISDIRDRISQLEELDKRRAYILESIAKQEKLTPILEEKIKKAETLTLLEDLYLPYKPKRRTKAMVAKEKGLESLALLIFSQKVDIDLQKETLEYMDAEKELTTPDLVLAGARDIIAEWVHENEEARARVREIYKTKGHYHAKLIKGKEQEGEKFKDYFDWQESVAQAPSHRVLAARRGEKENILLLRILAPKEEILRVLGILFVKQNNTAVSQQVGLAVEESFNRLMAPSIENEIRLLSKEKADAEAIKTFQINLKQLLMAPPLGLKALMAIDPGLRTGCKMAILDPQGKFLETKTIYLTQGRVQEIEAAETIKHLIRKYDLEVIAIGNGTASRETEEFIRKIKIPRIQIVMVNESGASYYSASETARKEFPDLDLTVRGAISIGRRLQDPLAELVKTDPKNIGIGQYQHDVDPVKLKMALDDVIISCVNKVGVDINTASRELLMYVSGVGISLANAIVTYRNEKGAFQSRDEILNVPRFSTKAFEQAGGFLRVMNGENPLDASGVHPESYHLVDTFAKDLSVSIVDLIKKEQYRQKIDLKKYVTERIGMPTLKDILNELAKPGRDPREQFEFVSFKEGIHDIEDLTEDMVLTGIVTNITDFGAFVDIGVHQDGLVHISELADQYVQHPSSIVKLHQKVSVRVIDIDIPRKRIALSMKKSNRSIM